MLPYLLLDVDKCLLNIESMFRKARASKVFFRPHVKSHQSIEIASWFRKRGVSGITVSSLKMAVYFSNHGWKDITIAIPAIALDANKINDLAANISLNILVESAEGIDLIGNDAKHELGVFVEIDTGYHRTGISSDDKHSINNILLKIKNSQLVFKGFLSHFGNTYSAASRDEIVQIYKSSIDTLLALKSHFQAIFPDIQLSIGDTPSCSIINDFVEADEIRPGNFVFFDVMQWKLGSCSFDDIAVALIAPVIAKHPERDEIVIHAGAVHLSKEFIVDENGNKIFGLISRFSDGKWSDPIEHAFVTSLSQEHGIVKIRGHEIHSIHPGDLLAILPIHSCLTANLMRSYQTKDGKVIEMMP